MSRTLYGHPIREVTLDLHPDKESVTDFCEGIERTLDVFKENMINRKIEDLYPEEWIELYAQWLDIKVNLDDVKAVRELYEKT